VENDDADDADKTIVDDNDQGKKGRGRPKKGIAEKDGGGEVEMPKKGRGRPKKDAVA
jgi:hypothetical protein